MRVKMFRKLNQKGMTLIEIIVAMAILGVVIVPTLRIFASTSGTSLRSRERQRATSVAEGTMESFKAYNMEALCRQFKSGTFGGVKPSTDPAKPLIMDVTAQLGGSSIAPLRDDYTLNGVADVYEFHIQNAASEGYVYDVDITATPRIAPTVLKMDVTNAYSDAIISLDEELTYTAKGELEDMAKDLLVNNIASYHSGATNPEVTNFETSNFKRVIDITVEDNGGASQKVVVEMTCTAKVKVDYKYTVGGGTQTGTKTYEEDVLKKEIELDGDQTEWVVYNNQDTIGGATAAIEHGAKHFKLNQIFLYYFPVYPSAFGTGAEDEINISGTLTGLYNSSGASDAKAYGYEPLRLVVAKQASTRLSDVDLNLGEVSYNLDVNNTVGGGGEVELRSNLEENLAPGSVAAHPTITGFVAASGDLMNEVQDKVALLYDVEIHVKEAGKADEVAYFIGTMNE